MLGLASCLRSPRLRLWIGPARAARYARAIAEAIHHAHRHGVLHRDIKPSNVLIDEQDQPRVTDFGLAKQLSNSEPGTRNPELTVTGQVPGSPNFMPPEQAAGRGREATPASDVYSLEALLYHAITGRPPFLGESVPETLRLVAEAEPYAPRLINPSLPVDLSPGVVEARGEWHRSRRRAAHLCDHERGRTHALLPAALSLGPKAHSCAAAFRKSRLKCRRAGGSYLRKRSGSALLFVEEPFPSPGKIGR